MSKEQGPPDPRYPPVPTTTEKMLCDPCQHLLTRVPQSSPGSWKGNRPRMFRDPEFADVWAGAHHVQTGNFASAADNACYICSTILRDCNAQLRQWAPFFRTFYQLRFDENKETSKDHYELDFTVEVLPRQEPLVQGQVFSCAGTFKILPQNGTLPFFTHQFVSLLNARFRYA